MRGQQFQRCAAVVAAVPALALVVASGSAAAAPGSFIGGLHSISAIGSTVPSNGDVNPYGVAPITEDRGRLRAGNILVSNFNASNNLQGTGTTIVEMTPGGGRSVFAHITDSDVQSICVGGVGLTTALAILQHRWVIVGSLPTRNGMAKTARAGCLIILDSSGRLVETLNDAYGINGPWDLAAVDRGNLSYVFVTNVLIGTVGAKGAVVHNGTVDRIVLETGRVTAPVVKSHTVIGSGFAQRTDPAALVVGPTGVAISAHGVAYVADSLDNRIAAIPNALYRTTSAGTGDDVTSNGWLGTPLGLTLAPNGDILTVNAGNGLIVETSPGGVQVARRMLDSSGSPPGAGALFGLALTQDRDALYFVDDATNTLELLH